MKVESSGWIHDVPLQPAEHKGTAIAVVVGLGMAIAPALGEEPNYWVSLVILALLVFGLIVVPPLFRATKLKVNICPRCNIRTTYNPHQEFCGRCGYRPERM